MKRVALLVAALLLAGCAVRKHSSDVEKAIKETETKTDKQLKKADTVDTVSVKDGSWLTSPDKRVPYKQELPPAFQENVSLKAPTPLGKNRIREVLRSMSGYDVRFAVESPGSKTDPLFQGQTYHFQGTFEELLNTVANKTNTNWKFEGGAVTFSRSITRTFQLAALPGSTSMQSSFSTSSDQQGQGGGSGGEDEGAQSETSLNAGSIEVWSSIEKAIGAMLSEQGEVTMSPGLGTVTVTDHPTVVKRVKQFVQYQNKKLKQRVTIHYKLLTIESSKNSSAGVQWDAILENVADRYQVSLGQDLANVATSGLNMQLVNAGGQDLAQNSEAIIEAFREVSDASVMTDGSVTTLNNQPAPVQVLENRTFVNELTAESSDGGTAQGVETSQLRTGFSMSVLPRVLRDRSMLLQFTISLSKFEQLRQTTQGVEAPETRSRSFMQRTRIQSGQTMILTGFEQVENSQSDQGSWLGGGFENENNQAQRKIVLMMTPVINQ